MVCESPRGIPLLAKVLQRAKVELMPEEPAGCAIVPFAVAGRLDHAAGRFWPVMEMK